MSVCDRVSAFAIGGLMSMLPLCVPAVAESSSAGAGRDLAHQLNQAYEEVYDHVAPTVVVIDVSKSGKGGGNNPFEGFDFFFRGPHGEEGDQPDQSEGSGFFIRPDGYILTNVHVIDGADKIEVKLKDGRTFPAKVVGSDERTDVAVIKIEATSLPTVTLANSDEVRVGQLV